MAALGPGISLSILYNTTHATHSPCYLTNIALPYCLSSHHASRFPSHVGPFTSCIPNPIPRFLIILILIYTLLCLEDRGTGFVRIRIRGGPLRVLAFLFLQCYLLFLSWCLFDHYSLYNPWNCCNHLIMTLFPRPSK